MKRVRCRLFSATFVMEANVNSPDNYARCRRREPMQFLTIADVAARLDVCERTVRRWIKARALPVHRIGGLVRVSEADFAAFLALRRET
jgi:excisionase family DNA binding protein